MQELHIAHEQAEHLAKMARFWVELLSIWNWEDKSDETLEELENLIQALSLQAMLYFMKDEIAPVVT